MGTVIISYCCPVGLVVAPHSYWGSTAVPLTQSTPLQTGHFRLQISIFSLAWGYLAAQLSGGFLGRIFHNVIYSCIFIQDPYGTQGKLQTQAVSSAACLLPLLLEWPITAPSGGFLQACSQRQSLCLQTPGRALQTVILKPPTGKRDAFPFFSLWNVCRGGVILSILAKETLSSWSLQPQSFSEWILD